MNRWSLPLIVRAGGLATVAILASTASAQEPSLEAKSEASIRDEASQQGYLEVSVPEQYSVDVNAAEVVAYKYGESLFGPFWVFERGSLLTTGPEAITGCFIGGRTRVRERIIEGARAWEITGTSIRFDFGDFSDGRECAELPNSRLRIGFGSRGTWSLVGKEARLSPHDRNMEFDISRIPSGDLERAATHEVGHALGLEHEHQNPDADCENEINWEVAETYLKSRWRIDDQAILRNFRRLIGRTIESSTFDGASVMNYELPKKIFYQHLFDHDGNPECYVEAADTPSKLDKEFVRAEYPSDPTDWIRKRSNERTALFESDAFLSLSVEEQDDVTLIAFAVSPWDATVDAEPYVDWLKIQTEPALDDR